MGTVDTILKEKKLFLLKYEKIAQRRKRKREQTRKPQKTSKKLSQKPQKTPICRIDKGLRPKRSNLIIKKSSFPLLRITYDFKTWNKFRAELKDV